MKTNDLPFNSGAVNGAPLLWLRAEGLFAVFLSILFYAQCGASWWLFAALLLVPDLSMTAYLVNPRWGAWAYNIVHSYVLPFALLGFGGSRLLPYALIWTAHIGIDRALRYGLKYPNAFKSTHLGILGKGAPAA